MIKYKTGNILNETTDAIINTVNCVGVMGKGLALQYKKQYPDNYESYVKACKNNEVFIGNMFVYQINQSIMPKYIINFPTKRHWRSKSKMEDIELGLDALIKVVEDMGIESIAIPPLGSGLGGLEWALVKKKIEDSFWGIDIKVIIYEPL